MNQRQFCHILIVCLSIHSLFISNAFRGTARFFVSSCHKYDLLQFYIPSHCAGVHYCHNLDGLWMKFLNVPNAHLALCSFDPMHLFLGSNEALRSHLHKH